MFVLNVKYPLNACFWYIMGTVMLFPFPTKCPSASNSLWQLMDVNFLHGYLLFSARLVVVLLDACVSCLAAVAVVFVLQYAAVGVMIFLEFAIPLVFSEENFPEVACCVLVSSYSWNSYRSFTQKYQDQAAALFEQHDQLTDRARKTGLNMKHFTPDYGRTNDNVKRIPKELFDMACEKLMPIRESVCKMFLEASLSVLLVFLVFSVVMLLNASPMTIALLTFAVGLVPKIVTIYLERRRQRNVKSVPIDQNALQIVKEYINSTEPFDQRAVSPTESCEKDIVCLLTCVNIVITQFVVFCALCGAFG